jgi:hypothetical protein
MMAAWGHPAAAIDTDQLYLNVDARWELPYDDTRNAMVLAQATDLAISLFEHGWQIVIICGNSIFDPADTAPILTRLSPVAETYHLTLTPALPTVLTPLRRHARPRPVPARSRRGIAGTQAPPRLGLPGQLKHDPRTDPDRACPPGRHRRRPPELPP